MATEIPEAEPVNMWGLPLFFFDDDDKLSAQTWIDHTVPFLPTHLSPNLQHLLQKDTDQEMRDRTQRVLDSLFNKKTEIFDSVFEKTDTWIQTRKTNTENVYYLLLEAICTEEEEEDAITLLTNDGFHRCVLACAAELILANSKDNHPFTLWLPDILDRTGITAFDFLKVIEIFCKRNLVIPPELRCHLAVLMDRLLESMVWENGSSMYDYLIVARPQLSEEITHLRDKQGVKTQFAMDRRMLRFKCFRLSELQPMPLPTCFAAPDSSAEIVITTMFAKILELAAFRVKKLVGLLGLNIYMDFDKMVYCLVEKVLHGQTQLFFARHLNHIIYCSTYAIAQSFQLNLNFLKMVEMATQVHSGIRSMNRFLEQAEILNFYSDVFKPSIENFLAEILLTENTLKPLSPMDSLLALELAFDTTHEMVKRLKLEYNFEKTVRRFVKETFVSRSTLCVGRHIDQIVLCTVYHIAKTLSLNLKFKKIAKKYLTLPQSCPQILHTVYVDQSEMSDCGKTHHKDRVNLRKFYKHIFAPALVTTE